MDLSSNFLKEVAHYAPAYKASGALRFTAVRSYMYIPTNFPFVKTHQPLMVMP